MINFIFAILIIAMLTLAVNHYYLQSMDKEIQQRLNDIDGTIATILRITKESTAEVRDISRLQKIHEDDYSNVKRQYFDDIVSINNLLDNLVESAKDTKNGSRNLIEKISFLHERMSNINESVSTNTARIVTNNDAILSLEKQVTDLVEAKKYAEAQLYLSIKAMKAEGMSVAAIAKQIASTSSEVSKMIERGDKLYTITTTEKPAKND